MDNEQEELSEKTVVVDTVTLKRLEELATLLASHKITTLRELRKAVGTDVETGIHSTAENIDGPQGLLLALLIAESKDDGANKDSRRLSPYWRSLKTIRAIYRLSKAEITQINEPWWRRIYLERAAVWAVTRQCFIRPKRALRNWKHHWADALIVLSILALFSGVATVVKSLNRPLPGYVIVNRKAGLPSWHQISDADLDTQTAPRAISSFTDFAQVRNRYTLTALAAGAPLQETQLLNANLSAKLKGRYILTLPLKPTSYSRTLSPPTEALMIMAPRSADVKTTPAPFDVIILMIETVGDSRVVTLAICNDEFPTARQLLASHDVFLAQLAE